MNAGSISAKADPMRNDSRKSKQELRESRDQRIRQSIAWSLLVKPLSFFIPLVTLPLQLSYLGVTRFGLFESAGAIALWIAMSNLGMGLGLINRITECQVNNDRDKAGKYTSTLCFVLCGVSLVLVFVLWLIVPRIAWAEWLHIKDPTAAAEAPRTVLVACFIAAAGLVASLSGAVYTGYQESHRNVIWDGLAKVSLLAATFYVVAHPNYGTVGIVFAAAGVPVFVRLLNLAYLFGWEKPWLRPRLANFDLAILGQMLAEGFVMFGLQAGNMLLFQADKLVIATGRNLDEVAAYSFLTRIFLLAYGVYMMYLTPLWPAIGDAIHRSDISWIHTRVRVASCVGVAMMMAVGVGILLLLYGDQAWLHKLQGGEQLRISASLVLAMMSTFMARVWVDAHSTALNAAGMLRQQIPFYLAHAALNLLVSLAVVHQYGAEGVAWSTAGTAVVTTVWAYRSLFNRMLAELAGRAR
jgi:O-antigen/teichoic acid export membrane protein